MTTTKYLYISTRQLYIYTVKANIFEIQKIVSLADPIPPCTYVENDPINTPRHFGVLRRYRLRVPPRVSRCIFFARWIPIVTPGLRPTGPLLYTSRIHTALFRNLVPLPRAMILLSLASFICSGSILTKPKVCILTFSNTEHSHRKCIDVSFSAPRCIYKYSKTTRKSGVSRFLTLEAPKFFDSV